MARDPRRGASLSRPLLIETGGTGNEPVEGLTGDADRRQQRLRPGAKGCRLSLSCRKTCQSDVSIRENCGKQVA